MFKKTDKKIFSKGGRTTYAKYGKDYMRMLGKKGGKLGGRPKKLLVDNLPNNRVDIKSE